MKDLNADVKVNEQGDVAEISCRPPADDEART
jgi:hypothetical protein